MVPRKYVCKIGNTMIRFYFKDQVPLGQMTITPQTNVGIHVEIAFRWRADDDPFIVVFGSGFKFMKCTHVFAAQTNY